METVFRKDLFAGQRVLVTGGGSGIGLGISRHFANHGAHVILLSRNAERLQKACQQLESEGPGSATWYAADVRDAGAVEDAAQKIFEDGPIDVLVNGAAGNFPSPFAALSANAFDSVVDIVLKGTANVCRSIGLRMHEAGQGNVINIVAGYAWTGAPAVSHSGAAKAGVLNLTRSLAVEWGPHVRVNAVSPGPIGETEGMKRLGDDLGLADEVRKLVPLDRMGTVDEVAQACLYLASPGASYVTGTCLIVDGGQDALGPFGPIFAAMK